MKEIKEIDPKYLDFERDDNIYEYHPKRVEQGSEKNYDTKYFKVTKSYEDMGF